MCGLIIGVISSIWCMRQPSRIVHSGSCFRDVHGRGGLAFDQLGSATPHILQPALLAASHCSPRHGSGNTTSLVSVPSPPATARCSSYSAPFHGADMRFLALRLPALREDRSSGFNANRSGCTARPSRPEPLLSCRRARTGSVGSTASSGPGGPCCIRALRSVHSSSFRGECDEGDFAIARCFRRGDRR